MSDESPHEPNDPELPVSPAQPRRIGSAKSVAQEPANTADVRPETAAPGMRVFEVRADTLYVSLAFVGVLVTLAYLLGKNTASPAPATTAVATQPGASSPGGTTALPATFQRVEATTDAPSHDDAEPATTTPAPNPTEPQVPPVADAPAPVGTASSAPAAGAFAVRLQDQMTRAEADELAGHLQTLGYGPERLRVAARPRQPERFRVEVLFPDRPAAEAELPKLRRIEWKHRSFQDAFLVDPGK